MADEDDNDRDIVRAYSQEKQIYRHNSISMRRQRTTTELRRIPENYYSNRNCPEILSLFALQNRHLEDREKQIYHSLSNDEHYFNMINYPIQSPAITPIPNAILQTAIPEPKETKFPQLTSRRTSTSVNKFPTLIPRRTAAVNNKNPMPTIRTSTNKSSQAKIPTIPKKSQLSHPLRRPQ